MFRKKIFLPWVFILLFPTLKAQVVTYNDVAVIYNINSLASQKIAFYFQAARDIPAVNMIPVDVPELEHITMDVFEDLRQQVEGHLIANQLVDEVNYLVTIKGVPLRIGGPCTNTANMYDCSSVDSELTLLLGPYADSIGEASEFQNPFYNSFDAHSRDAIGIYLVTRLDAYTVQDVLDLIDRSGPGIEVDQAAAVILADATLMTASDNYSMNLMLQLVMDPLATAGWNTYIEATDSVVAEVSDLIGYIGVDATPTLGIPDLEWLPGGLAIEFTPFSGSSFDESTTDPRYIRCADRISEGATGARGEAGLAFVTQVNNATPTFIRYLDTTFQFGLAESYYAGIWTLSSGSVIIGDPKTSITLAAQTGISGLDHRRDALAFPNPSPGIFNVSVPDRMVGSYSVYDISGRIILTRTFPPASSIIVDLEKEADGTYFLELMTTEGQRSTAKVQVRR